MAKGNSSSGLLGRLSTGREVKTFDNQRNAEQAGYIGSYLAETVVAIFVEWRYVDWLPVTRVSSGGGILKPTRILRGTKSGIPSPHATGM